ncbi:MAG: ATP phosphoribosyltransferase [Planctomycetota bacterium]
MATTTATTSTPGTVTSLGTVPLRFGLPKGRMQEGVLSLLDDAGIDVSGISRGYRPVVSFEGMQTKVLKPQNIIEMLHSGSRDLGFAGADWVEELGYASGGPDGEGLVELLDTGLDPVRLVIAAPRSSVNDGELVLPEGRPLRVAAEMPTLAKRWIASRGLDARVVRTYGATEAFPPEDADCILDVAATGETLRANGLEVIDVVTTSSTMLYASRGAFDEPVKRAAMERLVLLLSSVLEARTRVMIDLNVDASGLEGVLATLPAMHEPTLAELRGGSGFAVRAAVLHADVSVLVPTLKSHGARDIVVSRPMQIVR